MSHGHHHHHHPDVDDSSIWKLWVSIFLNLGITLAQVIGGIIANSLSLLSDAVHNFNDSMSLKKELPHPRPLATNGLRSLALL